MKEEKAFKFKVDVKTGLPFGVGDKVLIRTVTMYQIGLVLVVTPDAIILGESSWIADTGRLSQALVKGPSVFIEVEKAHAPWVLVSRGAIVDIYPWAHALPTESK